MDHRTRNDKNEACKCGLILDVTVQKCPKIITIYPYVVNSLLLGKIIRAFSMKHNLVNISTKHVVRISQALKVKYILTVTFRENYKMAYMFPHNSLKIPNCPN